MPYTLLTGSTGLLGQYLLRDLLLPGEKVAVLVRANRRTSARQRIENILTHWDQTHSDVLPRPVVLVGDINQPDCGLSDASISWLAENCNRVIHSAASLAFVEEPETGEPWRSNVDGTKNVLSLCKKLSSPHLVHISTAYVCGLTPDVFFENQLDQGQEFSNPYEASKVKAEQLVHSAEGLSGYTILRPSIITGDSKTGYAATFHGFYTPLRVLQALMSQRGAEDLSAGDYLSALSLGGNERKNFVPVDWVSDAILKILARQTSLNQTYALVTEEPVTVADLRDAFSESIGKRDEYHPKTNGQLTPKPAASLGTVEQQFREQFKVYQSYWRDECRFDSRNAKALLPDTPCPTFDKQRIINLSDAALKANFGFPKRPDTAVGFWAEDWLMGFDGLAAPENFTHPIGLNLLGKGGGEWTLQPRAGQVRVTPGNVGSASVLTFSSGAAAQLATEITSVDALIDQGLAVSTDTAATMNFDRLLQPQVATV